ncbi:CRISPR-associated protein Cas4 [Jeotgalibaca sp. A127]|uniref:CRISPR-associated protein Cas4 n=1 Tax=Jeotgalibaca sp. A127 TaxID=3457324 RepID=UPI003FD2FC67
MGYNEDDFLLLSGIQHFEFCKRQWALIHIEQQWEENYLTIAGQNLHKKADEPFIREKRKEKLIIRGMPVKSHSLGISGVCDVVEFIQDKNGVAIHGEDGLYLPIPIEYKHGKPKKNDADVFQMVAQAMCLEEMLFCTINVGFLFYNEIKRRTEIPITLDLRESVRKKISEMHDLYSKRYTPKVKTGPHCERCSLKDVCLPKLMNKETVSSYLDRRLQFEETT